MRIWFAANIPPSSHGGVACSMQNLAQGLRRKGHDVKIIYGMHKAAANYLLFALGLGAKLAASAFAPPDWIIARSSDGVFCAVLRRILRLKTRIIVHNHGWEEHVYEYEKRLPSHVVTSPTTWKARSLRFSLLRLALSLCDACICGALDEIRWLKQKRPKKGTAFACVPNGVQRQATPYWLNRSEIPNDFLCVGGPTWKKNLEHSVAVFRRIRDRHAEARLFLVGTGVSALPESLKRVGEGVGGLHNVPDEPFAAMARWYRTCPFLLSFSRYEGGHSLAILESMSFAMLVFASPVPSTMEIIKHGGNGCILSGRDPDADASAILDIIGNRGTADAMRMKAFKAAARNSWDRQVNRLEAVLCRPA